MAPPMAAEVLGRPEFRIDDLVAEVLWPAPAVDVGLLETAGGVRSPLAADGDCLALCRAVDPDVVVLVADAGLGTINAVRLSLEGLRALEAPVVVVLNRFDLTAELHRRNLEWLRTRDALMVMTAPDADMPELGADLEAGAEVTLAHLVLG